MGSIRAVVQRTKGEKTNAGEPPSPSFTPPLAFASRRVAFLATNQPREKKIEGPSDLP